ncbi:MAG: M3 family oligoendopeptidase [Acidobacteria bacterium]|nr:M3 family oligoendopeptidase [Acidobacteriota bacterium]
MTQLTSPPIAPFDPQRTYPRRFVPQDANLGEWAQVEPLFLALRDRSPQTPVELEQWLADYFELWAAINEEGARRHINMTLQTDDAEREAAFKHFIEEIEPKIKPIDQELEKAYLANPRRLELPRERYALMDRMVENHIKLFREENIPLETQDQLLGAEYQKIVGAMTVEMEGKELTLPQAGKYMDGTDRALRQQAWEKISARYLQDREALDGLYDQMIPLRHRVATNAGFDNYRDYAFEAKQRFDYTPEHCFEFHSGVERAILPLVRRIHEKRRAQMGLGKKGDALRPWDTKVDPQGRAPLRPFADAAHLVSGVADIFTRVDPELSAQFRFMAEDNLLDLESRKGKAPGGYQSTLEERRVPFIFMNAAGRDDDVRTLLHEGGHAFHAIAARDLPVLHYRHAPMEFCEVASMSMELLALPHLDAFYKTPDELQRARTSRLEETVSLLPWIAIIDAFQHWAYTNPTHSRDERREAWIETYDRFSTIVDWGGYAEQRSYRWHQQLHLFEVPFYYIEYGIAQLGALQVWQRSRKDYPDAVRRYRQALSLGGSRRLPELFDAAGIRFRFDYETLAPLADAVAVELGI